MAIQPVDKAFLTLHFEEFANVEADRIDQLNTTAALFVDEGVFGTKARYALALFIAHMLKVSMMKGSGGVTWASAGGVSESYATPDIKNSMHLTSYGQEYERIARKKSVCNRPLFI